VADAATEVESDGVAEGDPQLHKVPVASAAARIRPTGRRESERG
jgi:hypothetical protein